MAKPNRRLARGDSQVRRSCIVRPVSRRTLLRGAGVSLALPFLEIMRPRGSQAQTDTVQRFIAFFMPNGTDPGRWKPTQLGALSVDTLSECLQDLNGFAAEGDWPAAEALLQDVTVVSDIDHNAVCNDIHAPSMALCAHRAEGEQVPPQPTLDQYLADRIQGTTPFRSLTMTATRDSGITQGFLSFRENGLSESVYRRPAELFDVLFSGGVNSGPNDTMDEVRARDASILDWVQEDAERLNARLGAADRQRIDQFLQSVRELETQVQASSSVTCETPAAPGNASGMHATMKQFMDMTTIAMACDLTRVAVLQYSNSWDVNWAEFNLPDGVGDWSDHFISHKLDDADRATDLDSLPREEAQAVANARVVNTSRIKTRRFGNLLTSLKNTTTPTGNLLDESLVMFTSENGDGDSHSRYGIPTMLAGGVGGFETGRYVDAQGEPTGALHASVINYFGEQLAQYGDPAAPPISGL